MTFGTMIEAKNSRDPTTVDPEYVKRSLLQTGYVVLRGFEIALPTLRRFIDLFMEEASTQASAYKPGTSDPLIFGVDPHNGALTPHCEDAWTPFRPDLGVLFCERPASVGGNTTLVDGVALFEALSDATKKALSTRQIRYDVIFPGTSWQRTFGVTTKSDLSEKFRRASNVTYRFLEDDQSFFYSLRSWSILPSQRGTAFADSAWRYSDNDVEEWMATRPVPHIPVKRGLFQDGEPLPEAMRREILAACERTLREIVWQVNDLVLFDNWSTLHGRQSFEGERKIYSSFGNASWAGRPGSR